MTQKKLKILYTIPNFDTAGSGKVVYDLVKHLDRDSFEPEICCFHNRGPFFKEIEKLNVKVHLFPFAVNYRPFLTFPFRLLKTIGFFRKHKFDIIHSWHWSSDFSEPLAAKLAGIPWIHTKKSMGWGNRAWKWRTALSSRIITVNSDMKAFYSKKTLQKVSEIPFGVDLDYYTPIKHNDEALLTQLNIQPDDFVIVSVVNLIPVKGIEVLIKAVMELDNPSVKLIIVGNDKGDYANSLKQMASGVPTIQFLGKKTDVRPYHGLADLFVIPTLELGEGLPVAPLEAMASGRIVIGSNVSGVKDILQPFPACIFTPNDAESLKACILQILNLEKDQRLQLEKEMQSLIRKKYSMPNFIASHQNLYKDVLLLDKH
ncbi:glycosyltransferase involved in cell wall biosynthesis [Winogradskyella wandonensis]|uniref:Glycosyltransferase involved in cell wall biosynthesis n=1 Tax=Winogradskyella wandonensis TaxID=1442586 RepID=A0A4R1KVV3_9FLAO|nr:glycosyltransferase [Winogradskyella wandonensis]TCK68833.1 glycosyltransferase involved in cell wall biosynthesis [Winogradskyella wandonensis]